MADKDILEKALLSYADVFADCANVLMHGGEQALCAENLHPAPTESFYWGGQKLHNQFCDVNFYLVEHNEIKAQYIIGNETQIHPRQVLRKISYQGGAYRRQLESENAVYPVVSFVIDWTRKTTRIPLSLHGLLAQNGVLPGYLDMIDDVKLAVFYMKRLPLEIREKFTSDMGFVADFLNDGSFENRKEQRILHIEALCRMMEALTRDNRFTQAMEKLVKTQEGNKTLYSGEEIKMCEYIDMLEARGQAKGEAIGEARGQAKGEAIGEVKSENRLASLLEKLYSMGRDEDVKLAIRDENARKKLYQELCIIC